jgi:hypothetical protein
MFARNGQHIVCVESAHDGLARVLVAQSTSKSLDSNR